MPGVTAGATAAADPGGGDAADPREVTGEQTVVADYTLVTFAGIVSAVLSFASATLTTRLIAPAAFGALSIVLVTSLILQTATSAWTSLAVARFGREAFELTGDARAVTRARLRLVGPWFLAAVALVAVLRAAGLLPHQLTWPLVAVAVAHGSVSIASEHCTNLLRSWGRQRFSAFTVLLQQAVVVGVVAVLLVRGGRPSALQIALLYTAGSIGLLLFYVPMLWRSGLGPVALDRDLERRIRRFSTPLILFTVSSYVIGSIDLWILGGYATPVAVGSYAAVYRAYTTLMGVAAAASPVLMTLFVSLRVAGREDELRTFVERIVPALMSCGGALAALLVVPGFLLVPIVFGGAFGSGAMPFAILLIAVVAYFHCCLLGTVLAAHDRTADTARAITAAAILNVAGDLLAIGVFGAGLWAPAVATAAAGGLTAIGYARAAGRCTGSRPQLASGAYLAPVLTVVALAVVPARQHVLVALATASVAAIMLTAAALRRGGFAAGLIARRRHSRLEAR